MLIKGAENMPKTPGSYTYYEDYSAIRFFKTQDPSAPPHAHAAIEIAISFRGNFTVFIRDSVYTVSPGDCVLIPPYTEHSFSCTEEDTEVCVFILPISLYPEMNMVFSAEPISPLISIDLQKDNVLCCLVRDVFAEQDQVSGLTQKYAAALIASKLVDHMEFSQGSSSEASFTERCLQYCQAHYKEPITLKKMAKDLHVSYTYASYLFNNILQQNFCTYVNKLRVAEAMTMIADTDDSISDIAFQCGFSCIRTFNQAFAKQTGVTPTQLRKKIREK